MAVGAGAGAAGVAKGTEEEVGSQQ